MNEIEIEDNFLIFEIIDKKENLVSFHSNFEDNAKTPLSYSNKIKISLLNSQRKLINSIQIFGILLSPETYILLEKFIVLENYIMLSFDGVIISLNKSDFSLTWCNKTFTDIIDIKTYENDIIIYDELEIARITQNGEVKWRFSGMDHFISYRGTNNFILHNEYIEVVDSNEVVYKISYDGIDIENINANYWNNSENNEKKNIFQRIIRNFR